MNERNGLLFDFERRKIVNKLVARFNRVMKRRRQVDASLFAFDSLFGFNIAEGTERCVIITS